MHNGESINQTVITTSIIYLLVCPVRWNYNNPFSLSKISMALELRWCGFICFAVVAIAIAGSLWVILEEGSQRPDDWTARDYCSLLIVANAEAGQPKLVAFARAGHVSSGQPWMSCWRCVHPGWLLALRILAIVVLVGSVSWDICTYDSRILLSYTAYVILTLISLQILINN